MADFYFEDDFTSPYAGGIAMVQKEGNLYFSEGFNIGNPVAQQAGKDVYRIGDVQVVLMPLKNNQYEAVNVEYLEEA